MLSKKGSVVFKLFFYLVVGFLLIGCGTEQPNVKSSMYQSVNEQKATLVQSGKEKRYCARCGMDLVKFYKTSHSAKLDSKNYQYCSIHCLEDHLGEGVNLKNPKVVDIASLKFISVNSATYVVGSSKRGTMSRVSKYAFLTLEDAKKFQAKFGGKIMDFNGARLKAQEDFKHYR